MTADREICQSCTLLTFPDTSIIYSWSGAILSESLRRQWFWTVPTPKVPPRTPCWPNPVWCEGHDPPQQRNYIERRQVICGLIDKNNTQVIVLMTTTNQNSSSINAIERREFSWTAFLNSDNFSRWAAMTTQFKNHLQVPMTAGHSPTQALKICWCLSNGPESHVVLHSWLCITDQIACKVTLVYVSWQHISLKPVPTETCQTAMSRTVVVSVAWLCTVSFLFVIIKECK